MVQPAGSRTGDSTASGFRVGDWIVDPALNRVSRGEEVVHLRPKVMDVLMFLVERAGEVVSKNEILDAVWAKEFLADTALARAVFELREALGDDPHHPRYIETVPKRGYRLLPLVSRGDAAAPVAVPPRPGRSSPVGGSCLAAFVLILVGALGDSGHRPAIAAPNPSSRIVVVPFENLGSAEDAFLASGVAEEVRTRVSAVSGTAVISRGSAERLAGLGRSDKQIGVLLTADYVVAGAVRWDGSRAPDARVRITPRLVRVEDGAEVWAAAYDGTIRETLRVQSDVAAGVVAAISARLAPSAGRTVPRPATTNAAAHEAFLRGLHHGSDPYDAEPTLRLGLQMFERAVELDPGYATAWAHLAILRAGMYNMGIERSESCCTLAGRAATRALELDPELPDAHMGMGFYAYWCRREWQRALDEFAAARTGHGESAANRAAEGYVLRRLGRWDDALTSFAMAEALDPMDAASDREWGLTLRAVRAFEESGRRLRRAIGLDPARTASYGFLAQTHWLRDGDTRQARLALEAIPRSSEPWAQYWWFWQELFDRRFEAALERARACGDGFISSDALTNGLSWDSRDLMLGRAYSLMGRRGEAALAFEAARSELAGLLAARPKDFALHSAMGIALAGLGRHEEAIRSGRMAVELMPLASDAVDGVGPRVALAEILAAAGDADAACSQLDALLSMPNGLTAPVLGIDPRWTPLKGRPCFAALVAKGSPAGTSPDRQAVAVAKGWSRATDPTPAPT